MSVKKKVVPAKKAPAKKAAAPAKKSPKKKQLTICNR